MEQNEDDNQYIYKNEVILTSVALVGGAKLAYDMSKDAFSWFKSDKKVFIQLLKSEYIEKCHLLQIKLASAHIHSIYIEGLSLVGNKGTNIEVFHYNSKRPIGHGASMGDELISYPYLLIPGDSIDLSIKISKITDKKIRKENGVKLKCLYSEIDCLGKSKSIETEIRLQWK